VACFFIKARIQNETVRRKSGGFCDFWEVIECGIRMMSVWICFKRANTDQRRKKGDK